MNNPIIYQVVGGLLVLFFFYLTYMFTRTWRWPHITIMFFVFVASVFLCVYASLSVRTHTSWKTLAREQILQRDQMSVTRDALLGGSLKEVIQSEPSIRSLNAQLGRVLLDRGRVWRGAVPGPPTPDGNITVNTGAEGPNRIDQQMILYGFVEEAAAPESELPAETKVPRYYLTEFTVVAATDNSVTLRPTMPLTPIERNTIVQSISSGSTWALYETMPVDGHQYYTEDPLGEPDWNLPADEEPVFGDIDQQRIASLFAPFQPAADNEPAQRIFQQMVAQYLRDGKRANPETDPPENIWIKVRFAKPHKEVVDSDATLGAVISSENFFDRGRANVPLLQRGGEAEFEPGDVAIFPAADANQLLNQGIVEPDSIEPIFVRDLHNYQYSFREVSQQLARINADIAGIERDTTAITDANRRTVEQIQFRQDELSKLESDLNKFNYERDQIAQYARTVNTAFQEKRDALSRLYRENHRLVEELKRLEAELREAIGDSGSDG